MTTVTQWRESGKGKHWVPPGLPEPPRSRRVSEVAKRPLDKVGRALEEWQKELTVGNTLDAD